MSEEINFQNHPFLAAMKQAEAEVTTPPEESKEVKPAPEVEPKEVESESSTDVEGAPEGSQPETEEPKDTADTEEIWVTDHKGRKKVTIDYSDKEKIKKAFSLAYNRQAQKVEKDRLLQEVKANKPKLESFDALEAAWQKDGVRGIVNLLEGKQDAYERHIDEQLNRHRRREEAQSDPSALKQLELEESLEKMRLENARLAKMVEEQLGKSTAEKEQAIEVSFKSKFSNLFDKYRFAGKLGDPAEESRWDKTLFNTVRGTLDEAAAEYEAEHGEEMPDSEYFALAEREFKQLSDFYRKSKDKDATKKVAEVVKRKKAAAQTKAARTAVGENKKLTNEQQLIERVKTGGFKGLFSRLS